MQNKMLAKYFAENYLQQPYWTFPCERTKYFAENYLQQPYCYFPCERTSVCCKILREIFPKLALLRGEA